MTVLVDRESPSVFARALVENPEYGVVELGETGAAERRCSNCGGRMLAQTSKKGRPFFACEHGHLCGKLHSPCRGCGSDLPVPSPTDPDKLVCSCGAEFLVCSECSDGWLVERAGRFGKFLGCVNYPECDGKKQFPKQKEKSR